MAVQIYRQKIISNANIACGSLTKMGRALLSFGVECADRASKEKRGELYRQSQFPTSMAQKSKIANEMPLKGG